MKKMKPVFIIDRETDLATQQVDPENEWVINGEGIATIKFDGEAAMIQNGKVYRRYSRKLTKKWNRVFKNKKAKGEKFTPTNEMFKELPEGAISLEETFDPVTLHWPFWVPVTEDKGNFMYHEAIEGKTFEDGTYELVGPKVQNNPHNLDKHELWKHGSDVIVLDNIDFESIKEILKKLEFEGLVFHNKDGRMAKIRRKDMFDFKEKINGRKIDWRNENVIFE